MIVTRFAAILGLFVLVACGDDKPAEVPHAPPAPPAPATPAASADPLGDHPAPAEAAQFAPPVPVVYTRSNGMKVWLLERHNLPVVAMHVVLPAGAAVDPEGKGGLALMTAGMLDEGAGKRGSLDIARDLDKLGANVHTGAYADYAFAELTSLAKNLDAAADIFGDILAKPTFSPTEWKRVHDLWENDLKQRKSEPNAVANVVALAKVHGEKDPYGHPTNGTIKSAAAVSLNDVKGFYAKAWRPDRATCVVVGDIDKATLEPLLDRAFAGWKKPTTPAIDLETHPKSGAADATDSGGLPVVLVDRPDAPQAVISLARLGTKADDPDAAVLVRVNSALGGSFTSRLNQDLREEHGWTYGAHSRFAFTKRPGIFVAGAAVHTEHTGEALTAMLADVSTLRKEGLTDEEVAKTRLITRSELVASYESVDGAASRLGRYAGTGLAPDQDAKAAIRGYAAGKKELNALAASYLATDKAVIVIVGPRKAVEPQLKAVKGLGAMTIVGPEGETL